MRQFTEKESRTLPFALNNLRLIYSIEDPVFFGLNAFYKIKKTGRFGDYSKENEDLEKLNIFCIRNTNLKTIENEDDINSIENWINQKDGNVYTSRINFVTAMFSIFSQKQERDKIVNYCMYINNVIDDIKNNDIDDKKIDQAIKKLLMLKKEIERKTEAEKKELEKIITNRSSVL